MGIIAAWNVLMGADNTQFKKVMADSRNETAKTDNTFKGFLKSLKGDFGKGSALGQSLKLLAGGGAIAGLSLATAKFEEFTAKILELATATDRGSESFGEQFGELFRTLPIVGNLTKGFDNL